MNTDYDEKLNISINKAIKSLDNFQEDFKEEKKLNEYFILLNNIFSLLDSTNVKFKNETFQKLQEEMYRDIKKENSLNEENTKLFRKKFTNLLLKNSPIWKDKIDKDDTIWNDAEKYIVEGTFNEYSKKIPMYYKNFMPNKNQYEFEEMVDLLSRELTLYHTKLIYCKKIIDFLNEEFQKDGVFLTQTIFLHQYLNIAMSEMILVLTKLFGKSNMVKRTNFGFDYLKNYISKNFNKNIKVRECLGGELRSMIDEASKKCVELVEVRNSLIAHYDIDKVKDVENIKVNYEDLSELYELSVKILEKLSFYRFDRKDCAYNELIKRQGFKKIVCQNIWLDREVIDIDMYFNILRKYFL